jgi:hypothetical protein
MVEELDKWITNYNIKKEQKPTVGHSLTLPTTTDDAAVRPKITHQQATAIPSYQPEVKNLKQAICSSTYC